MFLFSCPKSLQIIGQEVNALVCAKVFDQEALALKCLTLVLLSIGLASKVRDMLNRFNWSINALHTLFLKTLGELYITLEFGANWREQIVFLRAYFCSLSHLGEAFVDLTHCKDITGPTYFILSSFVKNILILMLRLKFGWLFIFSVFISDVKLFDRFDL